ncbi:TetR-like C-terminal domain-containing protein [Streptomyces plumbiresistens]|uniref:HTH-type transcriptional regulator MT1864/Rv1816-like C-terminal domain-containing protein n=1 Tax=Streptomyces plumbiresistens TaxID=511811 RepID=A0ABP7RJB4_9ACTN
MSTAAPYRHVADRSELVATVAELGFQRLRDGLLPAVGGQNGRDHVVESGGAYLRRALDTPDFYRVLFGAEVRWAGHPGLGRAAEVAFAVLLEAVDAARFDRALRTKDAHALAGSLWSVVHGAASLDIGGDLHAHVDVTSEDLVVETISVLTAP